MAAGTASGGLSPTNWTQMNLGGGGNVAGLTISAQGVRMTRGDVFSNWIFSTTDNSWHNLATTASMPVANWMYYPANTSANQVYSGYGFSGGFYSAPIDQAGCPNSATCAYVYSGNWVFYSNNINTTSPGSITWCNTGGFTLQSDNSNTVVGASDPSQFIAIDPYNASHVIVATQNSGLFETFNGDSSWNGGACTGTAATWTSIPTTGSGIPLATGAPVPYHIAFDQTGGTVTRSTHTVAGKVYIFTAGATAGVYASTDGGANYSLTTGSPSSAKHIKVSGATIGAGRVWLVDGSGNVFVRIGTTWVSITLTASSVTDVCIDPLNGDHVVGLGGSNGNGVTGLWTSTNGGSANPPTFTSYGATASAGDAGWLSWAAIGYSPYNVECDPINSGVILAAMGQGVWQTTFPSGTFVWTALSKGMEGAPYSHLVVPSAQTVAVGSQDISGCQFKISTAGTPPSTCFPPAQYLGLSYASSLSMTPDRTLTFAKIGDDGGAGDDVSGYSTDGFKSNYLPLNNWNATVTGSAFADNGSGKVRVTTSTTGMKTWAVGDTFASKSIVCVLNANGLATNTTFNGFVLFNDTCEQITVVDSTHFDMPDYVYNSGLNTGTSFLFYVPGFAPDENFGFNTVVNAQNSSGKVQLSLVLSQVGTGQPFCVTGISTTLSTTPTTGCWVASAGGYNQPLVPLNSVWGSGDTYTTGGVVTSHGNAGGDIAAASSTNIAQVSVNSFPLCTTNGGASWSYERVTGDASVNGTFGSSASAGATTITIGSGTWGAGATGNVLLNSGRWLQITGTAAGSTLTFSPAVPPGDSIPNGSNFYGNTGYNGAFYNSQVALVRDWVTPNTFYAVNSNAGLFKWTNCGTPTIIAAETAGTGWLTQFSGYGKLATVPGKAGHLFFTTGLVFSGTAPYNTALYRTCGGTGSSATMQRVPGFYNTYSVGFGAPATGQNYPTIYVRGWYDSGDNQNTAVFGIWKSTNDQNNGATTTCPHVALTDNTWTNIATSALNAAGGNPLGWGYNAVGDVEGDPFVTNPQPVYFSGAFGQSYGIFNYVLKRDLDPASNDNDPVGVNKAA